MSRLVLAAYSKAERLFDELLTGAFELLTGAFELLKDVLYVLQIMRKKTELEVQ